MSRSANLLYYKNESQSPPEENSRPQAPVNDPPLRYRVFTNQAKAYFCIMLSTQVAATLSQMVA